MTRLIRHVDPGDGNPGLVCISCQVRVHRALWERYSRSVLQRRRTTHTTRRSGGRPGQQDGCTSTVGLAGCGSGEFRLVDILPTWSWMGSILLAIIGAAEWLALRRWVSWLWIAPTSIGMAVGLTAGAALVDRHDPPYPAPRD